ncbi:MAG: ABC transporter ATP-binding protein [Actinomycetota bacterium]|nr:ABC transporter ATP-binding protein [Actinomycetota bacterium]
MIEVRNLTKRYGKVTAVDDVTFTVHPGFVTGFLGPNGAGKSTTMRMILGLDKPDGGSVLVNGAAYRSARAPVAEIGALLEAKGFDKARSARNHLLTLATTTGISAKRVDEVLTLVGLSEVARSKAGGFSLGMGQRLGIAVALLGDPRMVMLDEPVNGLDPDGVLWIRNLLRQLADEGRTVFLSSHLMTEMELIADQLIIIGRGKILADTTMREFIAASSANRVRVATPGAAELRLRLESRSIDCELLDTGALIVSGVSAADIGQEAFAAGIVLHELTPLAASLEEAFMELTRDSVQFHTDGAAA